MTDWLDIPPINHVGLTEEAIAFDPTLAERLKAKGTKKFHVTWNWEMPRPSPEEAAKFLHKFLDDMEQNKFTPMDIADLDRATHKTDIKDLVDKLEAKENGI